MRVFKDKKKFNPVHLVLQTEEELCILVYALKSVDTMNLDAINLTNAVIAELEAQVG
jgi:hypothetical protein